MMEHAQREPRQSARTRARGCTVRGVPIAVMHHPRTGQRRQQVGKVEPGDHALPCRGVAAPDPAVQQRHQHEFAADPAAQPQRRAPPARAMHRERVQRRVQQCAPQAAPRDRAFDVVGGQAGAVMVPMGHRDRVQRAAQQQAEQAEHHVIGAAAQADRVMDRAVGDAQAREEGRGAGQRRGGVLRMPRREQGQRESHDRQRQFAQRLATAHRDEVAPWHLGAPRLSHRRGPRAGAGAGRVDGR